jgi:hypothetical protein
MTRVHVAQGGSGRVTLTVEYGAKTGRIDLPFEPLAFRVPEAEAYRLALHELLTALDGWEAANGRIET